MQIPLTPVQTVSPNLWLKRDDLAIPFGDSPINGTKTYQCRNLLWLNRDRILKQNHGTVYSDNFLHSPQGPIVARCASELGFKCVLPIAAHGDVKDVVQRNPILQWAQHYGAKIDIVCKMGLGLGGRAVAKYGPEGANFFHASFKKSINTKEGREGVVSPVRRQAESFKGLSTEAMTLVASTASGVIFSGILLGLHDHGIKFRRVVSVEMGGYDRSDIVEKIITSEGLSYSQDEDVLGLSSGVSVHPHEFILDKTHSYGTSIKRSAGGVDLDSQYEAKAWDWVLRTGLDKEPVLLYVVGNSDCLRSRPLESL